MKKVEYKIITDMFLDKASEKCTKAINELQQEGKQIISMHSDLSSSSFVYVIYYVEEIKPVFAFFRKLFDCVFRIGIITIWGMVILNTIGVNESLSIAICILTAYAVELNYKNGVLK